MASHGESLDGSVEETLQTIILKPVSFLLLSFCLTTLLCSKVDVDNADILYHINWLKGAKGVYDLDIDYIGVWNERMWNGMYQHIIVLCISKEGIGCNINLLQRRVDHQFPSCTGSGRVWHYTDRCP